MKSDLKRKLKDLYGAPSEPCDPEGMEKTVSQARKIMLKLEEVEERITFGTFFWSQLRFIKKRVWMAQFAVVVLLGIYLLQSPKTNSAISAASAVLPLCFLAGTGELSRAFVNQTAEMELSTKFTLPQVMVSKMTLLGLSDVLALTFLSSMAAACLPVKLLHAFMYFCVPFLFTSFGCLFILNHIRTKECSYYCAVWCAIVMITSFGLSRKLPVLYENSLVWCWGLFFTAALLGVLWECRTLIRNCQKDMPEILAAG